VTDSSQRQKPGPGKPLTAQRELYFRLMKQGLNSSEACRLVGIHRASGRNDERQHTGDDPYSVRFMVHSIFVGGSTSPCL
jgi:hypothetical protein